MEASTSIFNHSFCLHSEEHSVPHQSQICLRCWTGWSGDADSQEYDLHIFYPYKTIQCGWAWQLQAELMSWLHPEWESECELVQLNVALIRKKKWLGFVHFETKKINKKKCKMGFVCHWCSSRCLKPCYCKYVWFSHPVNITAWLLLLDKT